MSTDVMSEAAAPADARAPRTYYLVDGSGFIFRAFHALPMMTRRSDGTPINAVYGFTNMMMKLLADLKAEYIAVIFDAGRSNFRNDIYAAYKANRAEPPDELKPQFGLIRDAVAAFNVCCVEQDGYEADDLIAAYCRQARAEGARVVIVSSDKDLMQLVGDGVSMFDPIKNRPIDEAEVQEKFGVPPSLVVDVQALAGDSVDNVPGVPGIGVKTAAQLITEFGGLEALLARAGEIRQPKRREMLLTHAEQARLSRRLVLLDDMAPVPEPLDAFRTREPDHATLIGFLRTQEFRSLVARVENQRQLTMPQPEKAAAPAPARRSYALVETEPALARWAARAVEAGTVAVWLEMGPGDAARAALIGLALSIAPGEAVYVPLAHEDPAPELDLGGPAAAPPGLDAARALEILRPMLEDASVLKVLADAKPAVVLAARAGIRLAPIDDIGLMSYVLDGASHGHLPEELADLALGLTMANRQQRLGEGRNRIGFAALKPAAALDLAAEGADIVLRLHRHLRRRLIADRMTTLYETVERRLPLVVGAMEHAGIKTDLEVLSALSAEFAGGISRLETAIFEAAGHAFNIGSPKQLGQVLFEELSLPGGQMTKTGAYSTHSDILEPLAAQGHEIARLVLDWRQLTKLKGTYTDALPAQINPRTGRVHTTYALTLTSTGRLSSNDPNLQNIPIRTEEGRRIRTAFVAEPGHLLVSVDYSQIELRLVADIAGIEAMADAFRRGVDIHAMTSAQVFGLPLEQVTPEIRRRAKAINFGIIYGISGFGLANQLGIPQAEATAFIRQYLDRYAELRLWMDKIKQQCREQGYVTTLYGRKCFIPGVRDPNPARRGAAERQAINAPIQGTAADIIKKAMVRMPEALERAGLRARMLLQVHDELLFEAPEAEAEATASVARRVMEGVAQLRVPLVAEAGIGRSWAEAH